MLGEILRDARKNKKLTLAELAGRVGVTTGYLSNLENNRQEPSISVLRGLSEQLDIPATMLFAEVTEEDVMVFRKGKRPQIQFVNLDYESEVLTPLAWRSTEPPEIDVIRLEIPPQGQISTKDLTTDSDECIYVVEGELELRCGNETIRINKGGSVFIPKKSGHFFHNAGQAPAIILWAAKSGK